MPDVVDLLWRTGRSVGRTIYAYWLYRDDEGAVQEYSFLIGVMDTPELATAAVEAHNASVVSHPANKETNELEKERSR